MLEQEEQPALPATETGAQTWRGRMANYLGLERNVAAASAAVFLLGLGEELWKKFLVELLRISDPHHAASH